MKPLLKRTLFGAIYVATIVFPLLFVPALFPLFAIIYTTGMMAEYLKISVGRDLPDLPKVLAFIFALTLFTTVLYVFCCGADVKWLFLCLIPLAAIFASMISNHGKFDAYTKLFFGLVYIAVPCGLSPILVYSGDGFDGKIMLCFFILIWAADVGAYLLGSALGQRPGARKLAPEISPKKSWWGFAGAVIISTAVSIVLQLTGLFAVPLVHAVVLGPLFGVCAVAGDLVESIWKRHFGVKDSGNAIPGHGGFLDRLDSSIFTFPIAAVYLILFNIL